MSLFNITKANIFGLCQMLSFLKIIFLCQYLLFIQQQKEKKAKRKKENDLLKLYPASFLFPFQLKYFIVHLFVDLFSFIRCSFYRRQQDIREKKQNTIILFLSHIRTIPSNTEHKQYTQYTQYTPEIVYTIFIQLMGIFVI